MEVVVQAQGIETDSIVSIRVGSVRRQGLVGSLRPFFFPAPPPSTNTFSVDVYRPIVNSKLCLGEETTHSVHIPTPPGGTPKALKLEVRSDVQDVGSQSMGKTWPSGQKDADAWLSTIGMRKKSLPESQLNSNALENGNLQSSSRTSCVAAARAYLERFDLQTFFRELLRHVLHEKPEDPFSFLARHLQHIAERIAPVDQMVPPPTTATPTRPMSAPWGVSGYNHQSSELAAVAAVACQNARLSVENERLQAEIERLQAFCDENGFVVDLEPITQHLGGDPAAFAASCNAPELMSRSRTLRVEHELRRTKLMRLVMASATAVTNQSTQKAAIIVPGTLDISPTLPPDQRPSRPPSRITQNRSTDSPTWRASNWTPRGFLGVSDPDNEPESHEDWTSDEELETEPRVIQRKRAFGISSEAYGSWNNRRAAFVPPRHKKTQAQHENVLTAFINSPLFGHVDSEVLHSVINAMPVMTAPAGSRILKQGEDGDSLFVILSGSVDFYTEQPRNYIATCPSGKIFGELAMLHNTPRKLSVYASENQDCVLAKLGRTVYRNLIFRHQMTIHERREDCLRRVLCFDTLSAEQIAQLGDVLVLRQHSAGEQIVHQGDSGDELFILYSGECSATVELGNADGEVDVQEHRRYYPGALFGERALLTRTVRAATVTALCDVEILVLSRHKFERLLGPLSLLQTQHYKTDPRKSIADFYRSGNKTGTRGSCVHKDPMFSPDKLKSEERTDWFAVYRPTSRDAIAQMLGGRAVGKGLNVKGKSSKRGRQSGFVPFLQINVNEHKCLVDSKHPESRVRIFFATEADREVALKRFEPLLEIDSGLHITGDRVIFYIDSYPDVYGLEVPEPILFHVFIEIPDISFRAGWETGRKSEPAFMEMNLACLRGNSEPKIVLFQADLEDVFNPHGLLIAYAEKSVKPVVSDFDTFLVGSRGMTYDELPPEQAKLQCWALDSTEQILESPLPGSWTTRWLDVIKKATEQGFYPKTPKFGFGDATSYRLVEEVVYATASTGAVRHGAECFNFFFPQELDDTYLCVWQGFDTDGVDWKYLDEDELRDFLVERAEEGYTFPLNPIWPVRDQGWFAVFEALISTPEGKANMEKWFPPDFRIMERIEQINQRFPDGFGGMGGGYPGAGKSRKTAIGLDLDQSERAVLALQNTENQLAPTQKKPGIKEVWAKLKVQLNNARMGCLGTEDPVEDDNVDPVDERMSVAKRVGIVSPVDNDFLEESGQSTLQNFGEATTGFVPAATRFAPG